MNPRDHLLGVAAILLSGLIGVGPWLLLLWLQY
jgi:uncharacterized membrane protein